MQLTKEQLEFLDEVVERGTWVINPDGSVDVNGYVDTSGMNLTKIPVKFGRVSGYFSCSSNLLTSLEFAPSEVGGWFDCSENNLTSLEGAPSEVGGYFSCHSNPLKNYFKNFKEEDIQHWNKLGWWVIISEYPFLITIAKNYVGEETFIKLVETYPKTKLYLR